MKFFKKKGKTGSNTMLNDAAEADVYIAPLNESDEKIKDSIEVFNAKRNILMEKQLEEALRRLYNENESDEMKRRFEKLTYHLFSLSYLTLRSLTWQISYQPGISKELYEVLVHEIADDFHNLPSSLVEESWAKSIRSGILATAIITLQTVHSHFVYEKLDILENVFTILPEIEELISEKVEI
ncbi:hypothetical protein WMO40_21130 [Bacillaceae bacterium CLA-AA-H227]|uniref:Uncharacterized protein n=1 Tax=Robertmurraya yapensis (ex Hitch et al 2024) TaxID=3133160 RepID=A0ACC6SGL2_9BACI